MNYQCEYCLTKFEKFSGICPCCGGNQMKQLNTPIPYIWAPTDRPGVYRATNLTAAVMIVTSELGNDDQS
jgi:hypothetical protein